MSHNQPPRSKLAVGFYVIGALMLLASLMPAAFAASVGLQSGAGRLGGSIGAFSIAIVLQPILVILFGGVVQMVSDIRWKLLNSNEDRDA